MITTIVITINIVIRHPKLLYYPLSTLLSTAARLGPGQVALVSVSVVWCIYAVRDRWAHRITKSTNLGY